MSVILTILDSVDIICPYCGEFNEVNDISASTTIDGTDIMQMKNGCQFGFVCESCGETFKVNPEMHIEVEKV